MPINRKISKKRKFIKNNICKYQNIICQLFADFGWMVKITKHLLLII